VSLASQDEVLLVAPSRTFVLEYDRLRVFWRWAWHTRARQKVTLRTMPIYELQHLQRIERGGVESSRELDVGGHLIPQRIERGGVRRRRTLLVP